MKTIKERAGKIQSGGTYKKLEDFLGTKQAIDMMNHFAGQTLYFPRGFSLAEKYQKITKDFSEGISYAELAQRYGYTITFIRKIIQTEASMEREKADSLSISNKILKAITGVLGKRQKTL